MQQELTGGWVALTALSEPHSFSGDVRERNMEERGKNDRGGGS